MRVLSSVRKPEVGPRILGNTGLTKGREKHCAGFYVTWMSSFLELEPHEIHVANAVLKNEN